jgi:tRNA A37 threonylcarbamoyladenosine synthetase subunit TsaC/SUA5/YrdC
MRRIPIDDLIASPEELRKLRDLLAHGGVAAIPTETFYGLAADPLNDAGVRRIFRTKGRDEESLSRFSSALPRSSRRSASSPSRTGSSTTSISGRRR